MFAGSHACTGYPGRPCTPYQPWQHRSNSREFGSICQSSLTVHHKGTEWAAVTNAHLERSLAAAGTQDGLVDMGG